MKLSARRAVFLLTLVACSAAFWFWRLDPAVPASSDAFEYVTLAENTRLHGVYGFGDPPVPSAFREPGFPLLLVALFSLAGGVSLPALVVGHVLLLWAAVLLFDRVLDAYWPESLHAPRLQSALPAVFALSPIFAQYTGLFLSEILQTTLVLAALWSTRKSIDDGRWGIVAGLAWGALVMTRMTWLFLPFALAVGLVIHQRRVSATSVWLCVIPALMMGGWMLRNMSSIGSPLPAARGGAQIYVRAVKDGYSDEARASYVRTVVLGAAFEIRKDPTFEHGRVDGYHDYFNRVGELREAGKSEAEIDMILAAEGFAVMRQHPFRYAFGVVLETWKLLTPTAFSGPTTYSFSEIPREKPFWPYATVLVAIRFWTLMKIVLIVWGASVVWRRGPWGWIVALTALYFIGIHTPFDAIPRYAIPLRPVILFIVAAACYDAFRRMKRPKKA